MNGCGCGCVKRSLVACGWLVVVDVEVFIQILLSFILYSTRQEEKGGFAAFRNMIIKGHGTFFRGRGFIIGGLLFTT